ncbi:MAG: hypothetical protein N3A69_06095 [Leptospiraceae bacterium]|nr:hypothetical protein [Leptospiraceae bacterium]
MLFLYHSLLSSPSIEEIQSYDLKDLTTVLIWIKDKSITPRFKVLILERLNILLLENQNQIQNHQEEMKLFFEELSKNNSNHNSSYGLIMRKKICLMFSYFNNTPIENEMYEMLKTHIQNDSDNESVASCVRSLGVYSSKKENSVKFVSKLIEATLKKKKITEEDIEMTTASIELMSSFKLKQSILILMKILDSKYPTEVKNFAKKTLESIPQ